MAGSLNLVITSPLNRPPHMPVARQRRTAGHIATPPRYATPITAADIAMVDATERSMLPLITTSVMIRAMIPFSVKWSVESSRFRRSRKWGDSLEFTANTITSSSTSVHSHCLRKCLNRDLAVITPLSPPYPGYALLHATSHQLVQHNCHDDD